jgi:hypothetical protein
MRARPQPAPTLPVSTPGMTDDGESDLKKWFIDRSRFFNALIVFPINLKHNDRPTRRGSEWQLLENFMNIHHGESCS